MTAAPHKGYGPMTRRDPSGCIVWVRALDGEGYGYFKAGGRTFRAHRYFYERDNGPVPEGFELDHTCRNRACVNPEHLEPVTHLENCRRGALVKHMTIERARELRVMRANGATYPEIAAHFGIGKSLIAQIVTNRCWKESSPASSGCVATQDRGGK